MALIDARGWECPKPLIETKRLMDASGLTEVTTIVDNQIAVDNMRAFAQSQGCEFQMEEKEGAFYIHLKRLSAPVQSTESGEGLTIVVASNKLGGGSDELGEALMKSYLYALTEAPVKPGTLIFMNSGVFLTTDGSLVLDSLEALELDGTEIRSCGACLNYYNLQDAVAIGDVSNMYDIVTIMNRSRNTIKL